MKGSSFRIAPFYIPHKENAVRYIEHPTPGALIFYQEGGSLSKQIMIHAQRPDATACAEYDFWNEKMGRYVWRGSSQLKGIAEK